MTHQNSNSNLANKIAIGVLSLFGFSVYATAQVALNVDAPLSFEMAITTAQNNDHWLTGNIHQQRAIESLSTAVSTLPDPKVSIALSNLPTNGFDFGQEGMTQAKVGIAQMFPRGDTLAIKRQQLKIQSEAFPFQRQDRKAKIAVTVGGLWLDAYRVQQSIALIEKSRSLFEQLADVAQASYSSAVGKTRQQDIVRAQLELTRLEDRLSKLAQKKNQYDGMLSQWLIKLIDENTLVAQAPSITALSWDNLSLHNITLSQRMPQIDLLNAALIYSQNWLQPQNLVNYFNQHPSIIAIDKKVSSIRTGIKLAQQKYKPEWGVSASYGYRADDPMDRSRADLFSVGVTFDLPIFTENRQDKEVQSAISNTEAVKTEKLLVLKQLLGVYSSAKGKLLRLKDRQLLYKSKLLPQIRDQAEASLTAYTNDDGDFSEVVRSRIAVLNAEIDELTLNVEEQKIRLELNYLFVGGINSAINKTTIDKKIMTKTAMRKTMSPLTNSSQPSAIAGDK